MSPNGWHRAWICACASIILLTLSGCVTRLERPAFSARLWSPQYTDASYKSDLNSYLAVRDEASARSLRDRMVYSILADIEYAYRDYEGKLFADRNSFSVGSDLMQLGLAGATTITNGARVKTILSSVLTGVSGTSLSVDKNFFRQQTIEAIISSMQSNRNAIKTRILQRTMSEPTTTYSFQQAQSDLVEFVFAGTLEGGLQSLHQQSATAAGQSRVTLDAVVAPAATDLSDATELNQAITSAFSSQQLDRVVMFLEAADPNFRPVGSTAQLQPAIEQEIRTLSPKVLTNAIFRRQYFMAARTAGLIQ